MEHYLLSFHAGSFDFQVASYTSEENTMLEEFGSDSLTNYYLTDFREYLEETERDLKEGIVPIRFTNIVYKDQKPIGLLSLLDLGNELVISHEIAPSCRGKHYSSEMKKAVFSYI